jgi:hypothetical protein
MTKAEVLAKIAELQEETAPVKLAIGYVTKDGLCKSDAIVLYDCPSTVLSNLMLAEDLFVSVQNSGVFVTSRGWE